MGLYNLNACFIKTSLYLQSILLFNVKHIYNKRLIIMFIGALFLLSNCADKPKENSEIKKIVKLYLK